MNPSKSAISRGTFKMIEGQWHKRCAGPSHDEPTYLPATDKYFSKRMSGDRAGDFLSQCRLCQNWKKIKSPGSQRGVVSVQEAQPFYVEAVNRVGRQELSRRTGLSVGEGINPVLSGERKTVRKKNLRKVMLELISMRRKNEYRDNPLLRLADKKRANQKREGIRMRLRDIKLHDQEAYLATIRPVDKTPPDERWWVWTGTSWIPRYGDEMLGKDF